MTKKKSIFIRVTAVEKKELQDAAAADRRSLSNFVLKLFDLWRDKK